MLGSNFLGNKFTKLGIYPLNVSKPNSKNNIILLGMYKGVDGPKELTYHFQNVFDQLSMLDETIVSLVIDGTQIDFKLKLYVPHILKNIEII